jgi:hypothetical protein
MGPIEDRQRVRRSLKFAIPVSGIRPERPLGTDADWRLFQERGPATRPWDKSQSSSSPHTSFLIASLISSFALQKSERSCSVASVAMLVNAVRARQHVPAEYEPVTEDGLLDRVGNSAWKSAVGPEGDGVPLETLADLVAQSLAAFAIARFEVDIVYVDRAASATQLKLREALTECSRGANHFLLANFLQCVYTGNRAGVTGHHAPIAGYDAVRHRVFILDPDRQLPGPYWIAEERVLEGMATRDDSTGKSRGYVSVRVAE